MFVRKSLLVLFSQPLSKPVPTVIDPFVAFNVVHLNCGFPGWLSSSFPRRQCREAGFDLTRTLGLL